MADKDPKRRRGLKVNWSVKPAKLVALLGLLLVLCGMGFAYLGFDVGLQQHSDMQDALLVASGTAQMICATVCISVGILVWAISVQMLQSQATETACRSVSWCLWLRKQRLPPLHAGAPARARAVRVTSHGQQWLSHLVFRHRYLSSVTQHLYTVLPSHSARGRVCLPRSKGYDTRHSEVRAHCEACSAGARSHGAVTEPVWRVGQPHTTLHARLYGYVQ